MLNSDSSTEREMAYGRVSSTNAISCIDWLSAITFDAVDIEDLIELSTPDYKGNGFTFKLVGSEWKIWFKQFNDGRVFFSVNPSYFSSGWDLLDVLRKSLGSWALKAKVSRLDCAVTLPTSFQKAFMGLDFGTKRSIERYPENSLGRSVYVGRNGKRNEMLIYDKRKQSKTKRNESPISHPCTRIEIHSLIKKGMRVEDLPGLVDHRPFKHVTRYKIEFVEPTSKSPKVWLRYGEFKSLVEREGFFMARRILAKQSNRNFKLYEPFFNRTRVKPSLDTIFRRGMAQFFKQ